MMRNSLKELLNPFKGACIPHHTRQDPTRHHSSAILTTTPKMADHHPISSQISWALSSDDLLSPATSPPNFPSNEYVTHSSDLSSDHLLMSTPHPISIPGRACRKRKTHGLTPELHS
ncbi:hypothetical protein PGTUg99_027069 [Puccinia graminis f. sp. tritici]|uniref:Uncharacterized protein n=1 Tax=Puccinia graminis f. sp. tritici TaxID=56615 RepID=A0A5B0SC62_PUCGR|nr:hypothetical protein PGTUg99_027069 [Puccinia graminis f. sp. tritici]